MHTLEVADSTMTKIMDFREPGQSIDETICKAFELAMTVTEKSIPSTGSGGQDAKTGHAGYKRGVNNAKRVAEALSLTRVGKGNEFSTKQGEKVLVKYANPRNSRLGLYEGPFARVEAVIAALENNAGNVELFKLDAETVRQHSYPAARVPGQVQVNKSLFRERGEFVGSLPSEK